MQKVVLITGAASGIGNYIAQQYIASTNWTVVCIDINRADNLSGCNFLKADLRDEQLTNALFHDIPKIDLAINCAGVSSTRKGMVEFSSPEIVKCWQDNFLPVFNALKNEINIMKNHSGGRIINIASITGHIGMKNFLAYSTAKASIINMTKVAAIEHAENNIKINSISPATIDTPMIRKKYNGNLRDYTNVYHTKSCGQVSDIYSVIKMLETNNFMTGSDIKLDGGLTDLFEI